MWWGRCASIDVSIVPQVLPQTGCLYFRLCLCARAAGCFNVFDLPSFCQFWPRKGKHFEHTLHECLNSDCDPARAPQRNLHTFAPDPEILRLPACRQINCHAGGPCRKKARKKKSQPETKNTFLQPFGQHVKQSPSQCEP